MTPMAGGGANTALRDADQLCRALTAPGAAAGAEPEGVYMLTSSNLTSGGCCFDFGSAEANNSDDGNATMNAIYYGTDCWTQSCTGSGPWVGGDPENGMYFSDLIYG
jgi:hypothetical protein